MIYIERNNTQFGPYDEATLLSYVNKGQVLLCGIAGYFISFANLYPKYRKSLYFLAICIPAILHGCYDTFCSSLLGMVVAVPIMVGSVILLMTHLKQGVNYQSKLRN